MSSNERLDRCVRSTASFVRTGDKVALLVDQTAKEKAYAALIQPYMTDSDDIGNSSDAFLEGCWDLAASLEDLSDSFEPDTAVSANEPSFVDAPSYSDTRGGNRGRKLLRSSAPPATSAAQDSPSGLQDPFSADPVVVGDSALSLSLMGLELEELGAAFRSRSSIHTFSPDRRSKDKESPPAPSSSTLSPPLDMR